MILYMPNGASGYTKEMDINAKCPDVDTKGR